MLNNDTVIITLDRPRELWFGHKAQKQLQAMYQIAPETIDTGKMTPDIEEKVMLVMLQRDAAAHGETLVPEQMEDLLDLAKPGKIIRAITRALVAAYAPDKDDDEEQWERDEEEPQQGDPTAAEA